jgi:ribonuclease P protein component
MARRLGFGKKERLKSRKQIEKLFLAGERFTQFPIRVTYQFLAADEGSCIQVGVTAMKKHFKKAVDRNRIKRQLREAYRLQKTELIDTLKQKGLKAYIFFMYSDKTMASFDTIKEAMNRSINKLQKAAVSHENRS